MLDIHVDHSNTLNPAVSSRPYASATRTQIAAQGPVTGDRLRELRKNCKLKIREMVTALGLASPNDWYAECKRPLVGKKLALLMRFIETHPWYQWNTAYTLTSTGAFLEVFGHIRRRDLAEALGVDVTRLTAWSNRIEAHPKTRRLMGALIAYASELDDPAAAIERWLVIVRAEENLRQRFSTAQAA
jgi:hypothetical protein